MILDRGDVDFYSFIPPQDGIVNFQAISNNKFHTDTFYRFSNINIPGTYLYATGIEADTIRTYSDFVEEGAAFEVEI